MKNDLEKEVKELQHIIKMLNDEGKSDAECRHHEFTGITLLIIQHTLRTIRFVLLLLLSFIVAKFLSGAL